MPQLEKVSKSKGINYDNRGDANSGILVGIEN